MPELPDVEVFRRYLDATSLHQRISAVQTLDEEILVGVSSTELERKLKAREFECTRRQGKYLFAGVNSGIGLVLHFGMTGYLEYFKNGESAPRHTRFRVDFCNGFHLAYVCQRRLGEVGLTDDIERFVAERELGPDALDAAADFDQFKERMATARGNIKPALMNQQRLAGLGNIYSDEVLFQAGVNPRRKANTLSDGQLSKLLDALKDVVETAIGAKANPESMPSTYLLPHREKGGVCPACGGAIRHERVSGRTAYYCPQCQPG
ncbi:MAG: Fpg/Nei family DNA glycosylase [Chloroflexota bacterium]